jgi:hypothetical protein
LIATLTALALLAPASADTLAVRATACRRSVRVVTVDLRRWPQILDHARDAMDPGTRPRDDVPGRFPRILHVDRDRVDTRRDRWKRMYRLSIPSRHHEGLERDEFPPALARESDDRPTWPHLRYVSERQNAGAGASMGHQLRPYCDGQRFRIRVTWRR